MKKKITINIIGAGQLGKTLGKLIFTHGIASIQGICNTKEASGLKAARFIGQGKVTSFDQLLPALITLITTPDDQIEPCCQQLVERSKLKEESIVVHCSGTLSSDVLKTAREKGCFVASAHPMCSFAKPDHCFLNYEGTYCAMEGDPEAIKVLKPLFNKMGSVVYAIDKRKKSIYHAASIFASNYVVTLCQSSLLCLKEAGIKKERSIKMIVRLMQSTLNAIETTLSPKKSLTGPIKRGDIRTLIKHLNALPKSLKTLYKPLGLATLRLTHLPDEIEKKIIQVLTQK